MRKIAASYIMPVSSPLLKNGIVVIDDEGVVLEIIDTGGRLKESSRLEFYNGLLTPGFVLPFYRAGTRTGTATDPAFRDLDRRLVQQGVKAIGIVERKSGHFTEKLESSVSYHTILELCPKSGEEEFEAYQQGIDLISECWNEYNLACSISCCTSSLMETDLAAYVLQFAARHQGVIPLEASRRWPLPEQLARLKQHMERISEEPPEGILSNAHLILVEDPADPVGNNVQDLAEGWTSFLAPKTEHLPNMVDLLLAWQEFSPRNTLMETIPTFTLHAARALFEDGWLGSIEPGKKPGLNLLSGTEPGTFRMRPETTLKVLVR